MDSVYNENNMSVYYRNHHVVHLCNMSKVWFNYRWLICHVTWTLVIMIRYIDVLHNSTYVKVHFVTCAICLYMIYHQLYVLCSVHNINVYCRNKHIVHRCKMYKVWFIYLCWICHMTWTVVIIIRYIDILHNISYSKFYFATWVTCLYITYHQLYVLCSVHDINVQCSNKHI